MTRPTDRRRRPAGPLPWLRRKAVVAYRLLTDPAFREEWWIGRNRLAGPFQGGGRTAFDRYPELFAPLRDQFDMMDAPRILSYGCSTGEELLSLRHYLPRARLSGIDVRRARVDQARRLLDDPSVTLMVGPSLDAAGAGLYDGIVCLSVFQHSRLVHEWPIDCRPYLTFEQFAQGVRDLDRHLAVDGVLLLYHTSFRFIETDVAARYQPLVCIDPRTPEPRGCYDCRNRPVLEPRAERFALYRKIASS